ncbi:MAG: DUF805 domain-containing protein [Akkermansia sp.]|nr:DUF805 domain-containing protein [Akkermansia sp.]
MKYYYLDEARNICGPYTATQLSALVLNGTISADTLCAAEGEKTWRPLSEQGWLNQPQSMPVPSPPLSFGKLGCCVRCGAEQEGYVLPPSCPSCGAAQAPADSSMWSFFCLALRRLLSFRGRSQRKEYWSFCLFGVLFLLLLLILSSISSVQFNSISPMLLPADLFCIFYFIAGAGAFLTYPLLVRRLHDIGLSGWWVIIPFVITVYGHSYAAYSKIMWSDIPVERMVSNTDEVMSLEKLRKKHPEIRFPEGDGEVRVIARREVRSARYRSGKWEEGKDNSTHPLGLSRGMVWMNAIISMLSHLVSVGILIVACIDSQRGANKYGPSSKYPHA